MVVNGNMYVFATAFSLSTTACSTVFTQRIGSNPSDASVALLLKVNNLLCTIFRLEILT